MRRQVERSPSSPAIDSWDGLLTYAELDDLSSSLASKLIQQGISPDKNVGLLFEKSMWAIVAMLAVNKAGGCFVPLDANLPRQRLQYLLETSESTIVLTSEQNLPICDGLPSKPIVVNASTLPTPTTAFLKPPPPLPLAVESRHAAYIIFTSGSTGVPKGVTVEHGSLCSSTAAFAQGMAYGPDSRLLQFNSYWFDLVLFDVFCALTHGGCICVPSEQERMNDLEGAINRFKADSIIMAPSVSRVIQPENVSCLRTVCLGGEAILPSDAAKWSSRVKLVNGYGPTETCIVSISGEIKPGMSSNNLGHAVACRNWVVNPHKSDELAPLGAIGELCTEGPNLARGYLGDEEKTAAAFVCDPPWLAGTVSPAEQQLHTEMSNRVGGNGSYRSRFYSPLQKTSSMRRVYRTGDLVFFNHDGTMSFVGRMGTSQVKIRGQRVELAEIEENIRKHVPSGLTVAVDIFYFPDNDDNDATISSQPRSVLAAVFGKKDHTSQSDAEKSLMTQQLSNELVPKLTSSLPAHMVPELYVPIDEVPLSTSGKLDRKALQKMATPLVLAQVANGTSLASGNASANQPPSTKKEKLMSQAWVKVLGMTDDAETAKIGRWDNFIGLGGDSILAMRLITVLRATGVDLTVVDVFKYPALADMAEAATLQKQVDDEAEHGETEKTLREKETEPTSSGRKQGTIDEVSRAGENTTAIEVAPCTDYQSLFVHGANTFANAHGLQLVFNLDRKVDLDHLRAAFDHCAACYPTLRTRIVPEGPGSSNLVQNIEAASRVPWQTVTVEDDQDGLLEGLLAEDLKSPPAAHGNLLHRMTAARIPTGTILIWHLNHSAYDGWTLSMMLHHVEKAYLEPSFQPPQIDSLPFTTFIEKSRALSQSSMSFWKTYLAGANPSSKLLFDYGIICEPLQNSKAVYQISLPPRKPISSNGTTTTAASMVIAAWVLVLSRSLDTRDVTLAHLVTGRNISIPGIETCPGPTINKVPLRIQLPSASESKTLPSLQAVAHIVSQELIRVMPHEQGGLSAISNLLPPVLVSEDADVVMDKTTVPHAGNILGRLPLDLVIQPKGHLNFAGGSEIGMQLSEVRPTAPPPGAFSVECTLTDGDVVEVTTLRDQGAATKEDVDGLIGLLKDVLIS